MEFYLNLPTELVDELFNDQSIMELIPDEETTIETTYLGTLSGDSQGIPD